MNTKALSTPVSDLSCKAGLAVMEVYQKDFAIYDKSDNSPLTEADLAAHKMWLRRIKIKTATSCTESPFGYLPPWKKIASEEALSQGIGKFLQYLDQSVTTETQRTLRKNVSVKPFITTEAQRALRKTYQ